MIAGRSAAVPFSPGTEFFMKLPALHLKRYRQIASLLWKYGRTDLAQQMSAEEGFGIDELPSAEGQPLTAGPKPAGETPLPEQLADDLEAMGPTYVKLGQVLAGRPDLLPDAYLKALARLQDKVKPFPYAEVEEVVMNELGVKMMEILNKYAADNGFTVILDVTDPNGPVRYAASGVDVTADLIKLYDQKYPLPAAAAAPKPPVAGGAAVRPPATPAAPAGKKQ